MNKDDMIQRTKSFATRVVKLYRSLPPSREAQIIGQQVFRSGTSVGANYRAACRGKSKADLVLPLKRLMKAVIGWNYLLTLK
jgi:four helix bundle protein